MKIVTAAEMRTIDRVTIERFRVPSLTLMENAGSAVARFVLREYPAAQRISVLCGKGNNGGDGLVAARKLHEAGKSVAVVLLTDSSELTGDAAAMFARLPVTAIVAQSSEEWKSDRVRPALDADLYIDAILGTGFRPPVSRFYASAIAVINPSPVPVVAVDIPFRKMSFEGHRKPVGKRALAQIPFEQVGLARVEVLESTDEFVQRCLHSHPPEIRK